MLSSHFGHWSDHINGLLLVMLRLAVTRCLTGSLLAQRRRVATRSALSVRASDFRLHQILAIAGHRSLRLRLHNRDTRADNAKRSHRREPSAWHSYPLRNL